MQHSSENPIIYSSSPLSWCPCQRMGIERDDTRHSNPSGVGRLGGWSEERADLSVLDWTLPIYLFLFLLSLLESCPVDSPTHWASLLTVA